MINVTEPQVAFANRPQSPARQVVRCEVVVVTPEPQDRFADDLLPWADPYIASLMAGLQREAA